MKWISHILQGVLTLGFLMSGLTKLFSSEAEIRAFYTDSLGYAPLFIYFIAAVETIAAFGLIAGYRWRLAAACSSLALAAVMIGASVSHLMANNAANAYLPIGYLILLIFLLVRLIRFEAVLKLHAKRA